jgi:hypothetical protein
MIRVVAMPSNSNPQSFNEQEVGLLPRFYSAICFAMAGSVPVAFFFVLLGRWIGNAQTRFAELWVFGVLPILTAAFFGFTSGAKILDPLTVTSGLRAAMRGLVVAFSSYTVFILMFFGVVSIAYIPGEDNGRSVDPFAPVAVFFYGLVFVGWLIAIAGSLAGWLLFRISRREALSDKLSQIARVSKQAVKRWNAVGVALLIGGSLPALAILRASHNAELKERMNIELISAASHGETSRVQKLLLEGADVEARDNANGTPVLWAARGGYTGIVKLLLERGANPNVVEHGSKDMTPLLWAASLDNLECVKMLLDHGADVNAATTDGYTALMQAAINGTQDVVTVLLEHGADLSLRNSENRTALSVAKSNRSKPGRVDVEPGQSWTDPIVIEKAQKRHDDIIHLLESAGAVE